MRIWPASLLGQTLIAVAAALLLAQAVTSYLLLRVAEERREEGLLTAAEYSLWGAPRFRRDRGEEVRREEFRQSRPLTFDRPVRGEITQQNPLLPGETNNPAGAARIERRMTGIIAKPHKVIVTTRLASDDPVIARRTREWHPIARRMASERTGRILVAAVQWEANGAWHVARVPYPANDRAVLFITAAQTFSIFVVLMVLLFFLLRRITRPLDELTRRTTRFAQHQVAEEPLVPRGPADTRRLISAHNAMEKRIAALLDEKDVMLGAIGHDLKTPLAALRVRIESVPDEVQRERMAASIEDITRTLDDILTLARVGRNGGPPEAIDLGSLALGVVEEFEDLDQPVTITDPPRVVAVVQETWLKRALRNLVSNAVRYGGSAHITLSAEDGAAVLRVEDNGPGIPVDQIDAMMEPFTRGEASRNRATGGAGLGLTLARAIAEQHGGTLKLSNRAEGGLRAEIRLPLA